MGCYVFPPGSVAQDTVKSSSGEVIVRDSVAKKLPIVIYLHEYSYATGYHRRSAGIIKHF